VGPTAWTGLVGTPGYASGVSGTPTIPSGAVIISIFATAATGTPGTIVMFGGQTITVPAGTSFSQDYKHALWTVQGPNNVAAGEIVFTSTASYYVQYVVPTG
jgi:hypothetical protein